VTNKARWPPRTLLAHQWRHGSIRTGSDSDIGPDTRAFPNLFGNRTSEAVSLLSSQRLKRDHWRPDWSSYWTIAPSSTNNVTGPLRLNCASSRPLFRTQCGHEWLGSRRRKEKTPLTCCVKGVLLVSGSGFEPAQSARAEARFDLVRAYATPLAPRSLSSLQVMRGRRTTGGRRSKTHLQKPIKPPGGPGGFIDGVDDPLDRRLGAIMELSSTSL